MKLIKYRDEGMSTYTYFWVNEQDQMISPFYNSEEEATHFVDPVTLQDYQNETDEFARIQREGLAKVSTHMSDKGYTLSTHEKQAEFAIKRNYHISNTDNPIDFPRED